MNNFEENLNKLGSDDEIYSNKELNNESDSIDWENESEPHVASDYSQNGAFEDTEHNFNYPQSPYQDDNFQYQNQPMNTSQYNLPDGYKIVVKKKINTGLRAFLIVFFCIIGLTAVATVVFTVNSIGNTQSGDSSIGYEDFFKDYGGSFDEVPDEYKDFFGDDDYYFGGGQEEQIPNDLNIPEIDNFVAPDVPFEYREKGISSSPEPKTDELEPSEIYTKVNESTVYISVTFPQFEGSSFGTGVVITEDGFIATNSHIISDLKSCYPVVTLADGSEYEAVVIGLDKGSDLAVLKIDAKGLKPAQFADSDDIDIGEWVMAVGNPLGLTSSVTRGIVSGIGRAILDSPHPNDIVYVQSDISSSPGYSGGPLVNMHGQIIGINTLKIVEDDYEGICFSIPSNYAISVINELLEKGYVSDRVRFGITATDISYPDGSSGIEIVSIGDDSAFVGTDIEVGDVIVEIDGTYVYDMSNMSRILLRYSPGDTVTVTLYNPNTNQTYDAEIQFIIDDGATQQ